MSRFGRPGDGWGLARVYGALVVGAVIGGVLGYLVDLVIGPLVGQHGWWVVLGFGGACAGTTLAAIREFARPLGEPPPPRDAEVDAGPA